MDVFTELKKGLGNLGREERWEIYRDLRAALGIRDTEPMLPLPAAELAAWCRRFAELLAEEFAKRPATRMSADRAMLEAGLLEYGQAATDAFLDTQLAYGPAMRGAGLSGLYLHALVNWVALTNATRAAREVLPAASAALVTERYPAVVLLRHALVHEGFLGTAQLAGTVKPEQ